MMICVYCKKQLDSNSGTYQATEGWETLDQSELRWVVRERYACRSCVDEHLVGEDKITDITEPTAGN
jgi:hypothetical protein